MMDLVKGILLAALLLLAPQYGVGSRNFQPPSTAVGPPTAYETAQWPAYGTLTCTGGCSAGNAITSMPDTVGTNGLVGAGSYAPVYEPNIFGSLAGAEFSAASAMNLAFTDTIPNTAGIYSGWATIKPTTVSSGDIVVGGGGYPLEWGLYDGHQFLNVAGTAALCLGSATLVSGESYTIGFTVNTTAGTCSLYIFSSGTYVVDGAASGLTIAFSAETISSIGGSTATDSWFGGYWLDGGLSIGAAWSTSALTAIAQWSLHNAGV
jgi:hypothetical protein